MRSSHVSFRTCVTITMRVTAETGQFYAVVRALRRLRNFMENGPHRTVGRVAGLIVNTRKVTACSSFLAALQIFEVGLWADDFISWWHARHSRQSMPILR